MIGEAKSEEEVSAWDERLLKWQNETSFMPMFCSDLALSHEYAEFLLGLGGPFVAVLVGLARDRGSFGAQFLRVLLETLERVPPTWRGLQVALWACHVAARLVMQPEFEKASQFINDIGGVAATDLTRPPSFVSVTELGQDEQFSLEDMLLCPAMPEFLAMLRRPFGIDKDRTDLMLTVLDDDTFFYRWNVPVCDVLWSEPWAG